MLVALYFLKKLMNAFIQDYGHRMATDMQADMRRDLFDHIERLPFSYFDDNKTGALISRIVGDLHDVSELAHHGPEDAFIAVMTFLGSFVLMYNLNPQLALITGRPVHVPLGTHANKQGRVAGINIGGGYATFPGVIGTAVTKVCDLEVSRTGLTSKEAHAAGYEFVTATVESTNRAGYYPGAEVMTVKLIAERRTGVLLGAQIVGRAEAAKRIDALAVAAWNRMTVEEMTALDLSYAPPFAPVWDPVLIAARKATEAVHASL